MQIRYMEEMYQGMKPTKSNHTEYTRYKALHLTHTWKEAEIILRTEESKVAHFQCFSSTNFWKFRQEPSRKKIKVI